jgi:hypothetical protein
MKRSPQTVAKIAVIVAVGCLVMAAPGHAAESTIKTEAKKVGHAAAEVGRGVGRDAKIVGKAVAGVAKKGAKAVKAGAQKVKRNFVEE